MERSIRERTLEHFGYEASEGLKNAGLGFWPVENGISERMKLMGDLIQGDLIQQENGKVRIVLDYDPNFPWAMVQVYGLKPGDIHCFDA